MILGGVIINKAIEFIRTTVVILSGVLLGFAV
jgi:hypothetical protein